ncbi:hypothetical protein BLJ79_09120 [Arthrobacter sp. UCD-GKA]|nr:hypothetical protein BLJ79_09120 [Arthrobacter sp. UCD-GKA]
MFEFELEFIDCVGGTRFPVRFTAQLCLKGFLHEVSFCPGRELVKVCADRLSVGRCGRILEEQFQAVVEVCR